MINNHPQDAVVVELELRCMDCKTFHPLQTAPGAALLRTLADEEYKHRGHNVEIVSRNRKIPRNLDDKMYQDLPSLPWWLQLRENTDFKLAFTSSVNMTFTSLDGLASDSSLLAGASALAVNLGVTGVPLEAAVSGYIKNNATPPTAGHEIDVYAYCAIDDSPTYPDTMDGTDATKTVSSINILNSGFRLITSMLITATGNEVNPFAPVALSALFGMMPRYWSVWVVHNSGQAIKTTGNRVRYQGAFLQG